MDDDSNVLGQLGGFALSEVLAGFDLDQNTIAGGLGQLGLAAQGGLSKNSIYEGKYVDEAAEEEDYEADELEKQVDQEMYDEKYGAKSKKLLRGEDDDYDDDEYQDDEEEEEIVPAKQYVPDKLVLPEPLPGLQDETDRVMLNFPSFKEHGILNFIELLGAAAPPRKKPRRDRPNIKFSLPLVDELPRAKSTRDLQLAPLKPPPPTNLLQQIVQEESIKLPEPWELDDFDGNELEDAIRKTNETVKNKWIMPKSAKQLAIAFEMPELDDWESRIKWNALTSIKHEDGVAIDPLAAQNQAFETGRWTRSIIWDNKTPYDPSFTQVNLNLNDTEMLLELQAPSNRNISHLSLSSTVEGLDQYNMSNDAEYQINKELKKTIRQTFGSLEVQHAWPALKLQLPYYKTLLTKADTRSFHRPPIQFPVNVQLTFTKVRAAKKKKDKMGRKIKRGDGDLRHMSDITLKDTGPFVLWEFSEENPPIISNVGMGSIIVNYYRKKHENDNHIPQSDLGEPFLLDITDESPFKAFGYVEPGNTVPTLYNNLIRAPIFRHKPYPTDFLLVKVTIEGATKYYLRELKTNFVVGQTYPLTEVPGPHSRKISTLGKNRLMIISYKLLQKSPKQRIKVTRLTRYFPDQNDLQMRQKLKDFMEFHRKGPDQGYWMMKKGHKIPEESELLKLATPESACLYESMQVGKRHLEDAGYSHTEDKEADGDESKLDIEQQLAPWITTKNFMNATANKAMLKLHGEGDPTGRGEAFSFLRVSMKDIFLRAGEDKETRLAEIESRPKSAHRYNVQQQQEVYKAEIARIWKAQKEALSNPVEPQLTQEDEDRYRGRNKVSTVDTPGSFAGTPRHRGGSPGSRASSPGLDGDLQNGKDQKILRIRRKINGQWKTEILRDQSIIAAYVRQRQIIDEERTEADDILPSDDESKNERMKKRLKEQVEKLKRNQERRLQRKNQKLGIQPGAIGVGGKKAVKTETTRVCGNCGQRGHMKTSKKLCPRWHEFNAPKETNNGGALPSTFGGGLALPNIGVGAHAVKSPTKPVKVKLGKAPKADAA